MLGDWKVLYTSEGVVRWNHLVSLQLLQEEEGVKLANKLSSQHIN
jgi:hypothetical protein